MSAQTFRDLQIAYSGILLMEARGVIKPRERVSRIRALDESPVGFGFSEMERSDAFNNAVEYVVSIVSDVYESHPSGGRWQ